MNIHPHQNQSSKRAKHTHNIKTSPYSGCNQQAVTGQKKLYKHGPREAATPQPNTSRLHKPEEPIHQRQNAGDRLQCWEDEFNQGKPEPPPTPKTPRREGAARTRTVPKNQETDRLANRNITKARKHSRDGPSEKRRESRGLKRISREQHGLGGAKAIDDSESKPNRQCTRQTRCHRRRHTTKPERSQTRRRGETSPNLLLFGQQETQTSRRLRRRSNTRPRATPRGYKRK